MVHFFIINSSTKEVGFGEKFRKELAQIPELTYFVFSTRTEGDEVALVKQILKLYENDSIRIYCCGGSGTFRNILDAIDNPKNVELAFMPFGMTNDFMKVFGDDAKRFLDVNELVDGDVVDIDYINTNYGKAVNAVSFGADSSILQHVLRYRDFGGWNKQLPYLLAVIITIIKLKRERFDIVIDGITMTSLVAEGIFGNGSTIGGLIRFAAKPSITDGMGRFIIVPTGKRRLLGRMVTKSVDENSVKMLPHIFHGNGKSFSLKKTDRQPFFVSFDGELVEIRGTLDITWEKNGMKFVVPKGVKCP